MVRARVFIGYSQIKEGARANADQLFKLLWPKGSIDHNKHLPVLKTIV